MGKRQRIGLVKGWLLAIGLVAGIIGLAIYNGAFVVPQEDLQPVVAEVPVPVATPTVWQLAEEAIFTLCPEPQADYPGPYPLPTEYPIDYNGPTYEISYEKMKSIERTYQSANGIIWCLARHIVDLEAENDELQNQWDSLIDDYRIDRYERGDYR